MGFITKRIHRGATNRVLEPVRIVTNLDVDAVAAVARDVVERFEPRKVLVGADARLFLLGSTPGPWQVWFGQKSTKDTTKFSSQHWLIELTIAESADQSERLATMKLTKWHTRDGSFQWRGEYEGFRDRFVSALSAKDPTAQVLEG